MGKPGADGADTGGELDPVLGQPLFSWRVSARDRTVARVALAGGFAAIAGLGLLVLGGSDRTPLALILIVVGGATSVLHDALRPARGDSFQVFENGITDGDRTLLWEELRSHELEAVDEVTRVGGTETGRVTLYRVVLEGEGDVRFELQGAGDEAARTFAWFRERLGDVDA